ncbi:MAG: C25 family cysteine peptidase, partial [Candidatus Kapaibacteriota bacterium]
MNFTSKTKNITIIKFQYLFTIFSAILLSSLYVSNALETNYLNKSGVTVLKSTEEELIIRYKPILQELRQEKYGNIQVFNPSILGVSSNNYLQNSPNNLAITADITLPSMNGFSIKDIKIGKIKEIDGILSPFENGYAVSLKENNPNISANELINNYTQFPTPEWVELKYKGVARNRYAGSLKIVAARFNIETNKIEIPEEITVSIKFDTPKYNVTPNNKKSSLVGLNLFNTLNSNVVSKFIEFRTFDNGLEKSLYDLANDGLSNKKVGKTLEQEKLSSGNWFKIEIPKTGFYRISLSQLQELGFNPNNDDINTIKIFGNGGRHLNENQPSALFNKLNEQEIVLDKTNGTLNSIIFFAEGAIGFRIDNESLYDRKPENKIRHYINPFANTASYLLTWGGKSGKRASFVENNNSPINTPKVYTNSIVTNEETTMIFPEGSGRLFVGRSNLSEPFRNLLHNLDRSGNILYRVQVANKDVNSSNFTFLENENELAKNIIVNGQGNYEYVHANYNEFEFTGSAANVSADNRSAFKINFANKSSTVITFFDYLEIHYPRSLVAIDNEIEIFTDKTLNGTTQYNISGFEGNKYGVDITDITNPIFIKNSANDADKFIFNTDLVQNEPKRFFAASKTNTPNISRIEFANLREDFANSNVILITHKDLMGSALKFKEYRESVSNLKIAIIDVEHIMNEFASGMTDPTAIRDFLAFTLQNWTTKPEYLIMWGKGHFDYRGITSKTKSYVPVYEIDAPFNISRGERPEVNEINSSCFDDYFTRLVGNDDLIDIALGRVPIDAPSVGFDFVEKIKHYEKNSANDEWRTSTIMLADDGPTWKGNDGATHINQTEGLVNDYVPHTFYTNKIYLPEYPTVFLSNSERSRRKPAVTPFLLDKINNSG